MRSIGPNLYAALRSLREQKSRAALSALGITVGAIAIILLVSIATGVREDITGQVKDLGVNTLVVVPGRIDQGSFNPNFAGESYLKEEDAKRLALVPGVVRAEPFSFLGGGIRYGKKESYPLLVAATPGWFALRPVQMLSGRTLQEQDKTADVAVIGSVAKKELFGEAEAVGKEVTINARSYRIVGVTADKKTDQSLMSFGSLQNLVYVPYARLKALQPDLPTNRIFVQARPDVEPKTLLKRLDAAMAKRLDRQQFQVLTQEDLLGLVFKLMGILTWLLTGLTSIALFVGGVGILAVMLMSVNERAREIGVRKTVGARRSDIFWQFLFESIALSLIGGLVGLGVSWIACEALYRFTPIKPLISWGIVGLAFGVCGSVGIVAGLIPAVHAAKKEPVGALRME